MDDQFSGWLSLADEPETDMRASFEWLPRVFQHRPEKRRRLQPERLERRCIVRYDILGDGSDHLPMKL
jgi:hypothetical protein